MFTDNEDMINLDKIRHIWIEEGVNGFFLMGEFEEDYEEVSLSNSYETRLECIDVMKKIMRYKIY